MEYERVLNKDETFQKFVESQHLTPQQAEQFSCYLSLLLTAREQFNLTAISTVKDTIEYHFNDSLSLAQTLDFTAITCIADIGTGGGLPGIPLKIRFPQIAMILVEVNSKKVEFLNDVIKKLQLVNIQVIQCDWRTFLRKTNVQIDLFVARASLHTDELVRLFRPGCFYNKALLVYWASQHWHLSEVEKPYFLKDYVYTIDHKKRKLVFFKKH